MSKKSFFNALRHAVLSRSGTVLMLMPATVTMAYAQNDSAADYYADADGYCGQELKTALATIIRPHTELKYNDLWEAFMSTDKRPDGKVWDMYSCITSYVFVTSGGTYRVEGDCYNREHSLPKSWFDDKEPMYTDLMHIVPTDGYVNGQRSNYPFGETEGERYMSEEGFSKLGESVTGGYTGTVFEPNDEYKGDFARIYFYMVTCYEDNVSTWRSDMLSGNTYPALSDWALDMLMRWADDDPVSQKEIDRNNAVCELQHNRNPYVDYPGLEQYIWGDKQDTPFRHDGSTAIAVVTVPTKDVSKVDVYTVAGVRVRSGVSAGNATDDLRSGIYIVNGKKYVVR